MNWLKRARREILGLTANCTADTAERNPTAVTTVPDVAQHTDHAASNGSIGSVQMPQLLENEALLEDFQERTAILEFDGGMDQEAAEQAAWMLITGNLRLH